MFALFKKEVRYFFTSPIGYTVIGLFIVLCTLFLWILKTDFNILNSGFADLLPFQAIILGFCIFNSGIDHAEHIRRKK